MEKQIFYQISVVMVIAAIVSFVARIFRQPMIIAYTVAGFLVGPSVLHVITNREAFESFSQIGIALLLFIIGLGLNVSVIKTAGKPVALTFLTILLGIGVIGLIVSLLFGFTNKESLVMATALLFSSTIIVVKSLSDKGEQSRLYGRIAIGILLVEDIVATLVLLFISASTGNGSALADVMTLLAKGALLGAVLTLAGGYILPRMSKFFATSQELLYIFAIAWAFGIASAFQYAGFSIEIGALFAGVALASLPYAQAITTKLKPLRDFFLVLFFITLGESLQVGSLSSAILPALAFSLVVLVAKPVLIMSSLGRMGYTKQTSFKTGIHLSQISEFSIILLVLAAHFRTCERSNGGAITTLTALITIGASAYLMKYDNVLYHHFQKVLSVFERADTKKDLKNLNHYPLVLFGYHQGGSKYVATFRKMNKPFVVVDYNPDIIETLDHARINNLYGDATDLELLEEIDIHRAELIISIIDDTATNCMLADHITSKNKQAVFICHAAKLNDALDLYNAGATYVMIPQYIGDQYIDDFLERNGTNKHAFTKYRHDHLINLANVALKS